MSVFDEVQAVFRLGTSLLAQLPDLTAAGGNARGAGAVDLQTTRSAATQVASGANSGIVSGTNNTANGVTAFVGGGNSNTASSSNATVVAGAGNLASNTSAFVGAGTSNQATNTNATVAGGSANLASGNVSAIAGGQNNVANGAVSWSPGGSGSSARFVRGRGSWAAIQIAVAGDNQAGTQHMAAITTDATGTRMTADLAAPSTTNTFNVPNYGRFAGRVVVCAGAAGSTASAEWVFDLSAVRGLGASTTALFRGGGTAIAPTGSTGGASVWRIDVTADTTNGGVAITVTGVAATTIYWSARWDTTEVMLPS